MLDTCLAAKIVDGYPFVGKSVAKMDPSPAPLPPPPPPGVTEGHCVTRREPGILN